jgi:hypothetical protein
MKKDKVLLLGTNIMVKIRNGRLSTLMKRLKCSNLEDIKYSDSILIGHSTSKH